MSQSTGASCVRPVGAIHSGFSALDALLLFFLLNLALQPLTEPDFGWHLRTGLDLLGRGGSLPAMDPYSHTMPDWPWVEHAWLMDILIALIYRGFGSAGALWVIILFAAITLGSFWLVSGLSRASRSFNLLAMAIAAMIALPFLGPRTQLMSLLGIAVLLRLWVAYREERLAHLWGVPLLFLVWSNLHGGFTAGLFLLTLILASSVALRLGLEGWPPFCRKRLAGRLDEPVLQWTQIRHVAVVIGVAGAATLLNPYGWRLHAEIYASLTDRFMIQTLHEWQPVSLTTDAGRYYVVYLVALGTALACCYRRKEPVRWIVLSTFLVFSLLHWRNVLLFLLLGLPLCAEMLSGLATQAAARLSRWRYRERPAMLVVVLGLAVGLVALGPDHLQRVVQCGVEPAAFFRQSEYPIEAVDWIRAHRNGVGARMFNEYGHGGFLLWWLPEEKVFIDGRMPTWRIGERWVYADYLALLARDPPDLDLLRKYGVDWAIVAEENPLQHALAGHKAWEEVYRDQKVAIYVMRAD